jgi:hypothetical protein
MVTKRQLGVAVLCAALVLLVGIVAVDVLGAGRWGGFGPLQRLGIGASLIVGLVGLLLYRLGDRPA